MTTTNLECAVIVLAKHREARAWADLTVAQDLLTQLGLDPEGVAENAIVPADPALVTEDQVAAAEAAAKEATDKAEAARAALDGQHVVPEGAQSHVVSETRSPHEDVAEAQHDAEAAAQADANAAEQHPQAPGVTGSAA
jgi:sulfur carrier protein ThiS